MNADEGKVFLAYGMLADACKQLAQLSGENLEHYARTFAILAQPLVDDPALRKLAGLSEKSEK